MKLIIEATDEADAYALKERIIIFLSTLDKGDYKGRVVEVIQ